MLPVEQSRAEAIMLRAWYIPCCSSSRDRLRSALARNCIRLSALHRQAASLVVAWTTLPVSACAASPVAPYTEECCAMRCDARRARCLRRVRFVAALPARVCASMQVDGRRGLLVHAPGGSGAASLFGRRLGEGKAAAAVHGLSSCAAFAPQACLSVRSLAWRPRHRASWTACTVQHSSATRPGHALPAALTRARLQYSLHGSAGTSRSLREYWQARAPGAAPVGSSSGYCLHGALLAGTGTAQHRTAAHCHLLPAFSPITNASSGGMGVHEPGPGQMA